MLAIRRQELDYYTSRFSNIGTRAALFTGFTLAALIHLDIQTFQTHIFWKIIFWISTSCCTVLTLHNVLTTTFANIFGPKLALRGPAG